MLCIRFGPIVIIIGLEKRQKEVGNYDLNIIIINYWVFHIDKQILTPVKDALFMQRKITNFCLVLD